MVPQPKKKPPKKLPRGHMRKPVKPTKKKSKLAKPEAAGDPGIGGTINQITCTLSFSLDATAVSIGVSQLESAVTGVNVYWNTGLIWTTTAWDDPALAHIPCSCVPATPCSLRIDLIYPNPTGIVGYRKTNIYPTPGGNPTVPLAKLP